MSTSRKIDICDGSESMPVYFRDLCPSTTLQLDFQYVCCNIPGPGTPTELFEELLEGCQCKGESCDQGEVQSCSCQRYGASYRDPGRINDAALIVGNTCVVQECNSNCMCSMTCNNRVVQKGVGVRMEVFGNHDKGLGLRTLDVVPRGHFLCEYAGEVLTADEARQRLTALTKDDMNYLFILREHVTSGVTCTYIDPRYRGNIGRFINHSCEPNLSIVPVRVHTAIPRVCLFAARDIDAGEEVTYDYGQNATQSCQSDVEQEDVHRKVCRCASKHCRGVLPFDTVDG